MGNEKKVAAIDTDFFNKFTHDGRDSKFFIEVMEALNVSPVMHKYVYEKELMGNSAARYLIEEQRMKLYTYEDFLCGENEMYEDTFRHLYSILNGKEFDDTYSNVYDYSKSDESLGEIRTILMAVYMGIGMFFSDDGDSKEIVKNHFKSAKRMIHVYNVFDTLIKLKKSGKYRWKDIRGFAKEKLSKKKYNVLNDIWHE